MPAYISQKGFDDMVEENMEDFGMKRSEAVIDAVEQLKAQGVDLSAIDTSSDDSDFLTRSEILRNIDELKKIDDDSGSFAENIMERVEFLANKCSAKFVLDAEVAKRNKQIVGASGVQSIARFITPLTDKKVLQCALQNLKTVCSGSDVNKCAFHSGYMDLLVKTGLNQLSEIETALRILNLVKVLCTKNEQNKANFMRCGGGTMVVSTVTAYLQNEQAVCAACEVIRVLTMGDDQRHDFSCAYENVKYFVSNDMISLLIKGAILFWPDLTSREEVHEDENINKIEISNVILSILQALKQLAINDAAVRALMEARGGEGMQMILNALQDFVQDIEVCRAVLGVIRNVCGNDKHKGAIAKGRGLKLVLLALEKHPNDPLIQENGIAALAQMCLRSPSNSETIISEGAATLVMQAMHQHSSSVPLQRQSCLLMRNIAARCTDIRQILLDEGIEGLLRSAGTHRGAIDEAYAALRDLGCEVQLVTIDANGEKTVGFEAFGQNRPQFNPSLEETAGLQAIVEESSAPPAMLGFKL